MTYRLTVLLLLLFSNACVISLADETLTTKRQSFDASNLTRARFETGAGKLDIIGRQGNSTIEVVAEYRGHPSARRDAQQIIDSLKLTMEIRGNSFYLKTESLNHWNWGDGGYIDLDVIVPARLALDIEDGSGSMTVIGIDNDVKIEDGSGDIRVEDVRGNLEIHDGSGSIHIRNVGKNIDITDGSGSIDIVRAGGDVRIDDGSGSIDVRDVGGRLDVPHKGSGSIHYSDVRGEVQVPRRKHRT